MPTYKGKGDAIKGEKLAFNCRKHFLHRKPTPGTSSHRAKSGTLSVNAFCVIEKEFRLLHEKE